MDFKYSVPLFLTLNSPFWSDGVIQVLVVFGKPAYPNFPRRRPPNLAEHIYTYDL